MCGAAARHTRAPTQRPRPERPTRSRAARAAGAPRFAAVPRRLQEKTRALGRNVRCARGLHVLRRSRAAPTRARENPVPKDPPSAERRRSVCARVACAFQRHPPSTLRADPAEEVHSAATGCDPGAKDRAARPRRSSPKALPAAPGACELCCISVPARTARKRNRVAFKGLAEERARLRLECLAHESICLSGACAQSAEGLITRICLLCSTS